jgi:hypothetical protein
MTRRARDRVVRRHLLLEEQDLAEERLASGDRILRRHRRRWQLREGAITENDEREHGHEQEAHGGPPGRDTNHLDRGHTTPLAGRPATHFKKLRCHDDVSGEASGFEHCRPLVRIDP